MKNRKILCLLLCTCMLSTGCSNIKFNEDEPLNQTINTTNPAPSADQIKLNSLRPMAYGNVEGLSLPPGSNISIIGKSATNSFWEQVQLGAQKAIDDINEMLEYKGSDKVSLTYNAPSDSKDVDEQINILDEELSRYPTAIGIAPIDESACSIQFDLAADNQIPIVTFDSGSNFPQVASHISTNNIESSQTVAQKLASLMNEEGELAVIVPDSVSMTGQDRLNGFVDTIKKEYPNITIVDTYCLDKIEERKSSATAENPDIELTQEDVISSIIESHPNLKALYATDLDTTQLVTSVLSDYSDREILCIGYDGGEEQLSLLEDGKLDGLIVQNPFGIGYATIVAAARASLGLGNESFVDSGYIWVTKDNVDSTTIAGMLY